MGFRPKYSVDDAFVIYESFLAKSLEWNIPLYCASLDLRKAFDRIEYSVLFSALRSQGVSEDYIAILASMYQNKSGRIRGGNESFLIERGVKQCDIISLLLFNAGLEDAIRKWKLRIHGLGINIGEDELLTNIRYADDLMIYAMTLNDMDKMLEILVEELQKVGLQLNTAKCKILSLVPNSRSSFLDINGDFMGIDS